MSGPTLSQITSAPRAESESILGEKYKVSRLLGEGGMGAVYEAENTWTRRKVAIKLMHPEFARDAEAVQRFLREAQSAAQIDHPNVVSVLDLGRDAASGSLFIVQEFLVGRELRTLLEARGVLPAEETLALMLPVIDGLVAAHALGVVHRDLKPENIFLVESRTGRLVPKLIDFGIAKALRPGEHEFRTLVSQTIGTPAYMSPEQARGEADVDARTDVWSIGVVLYELLSGRTPFEADPNPQVMLARVITQEPLSLDSAAPSVGPDLRAVIGRALLRERDQRYPDMQSFYAALAQTQVGARVRDTLRQRGATDSTTATPTPTPASMAAPPVSPAPSRRTPLIVGAVVTVLLLLGLATWLPPRRADAPTPPRVTLAPPPPTPVHAPPLVVPPARPPVAVPAPVALAAPPPVARPVVIAAPVDRHAGRPPRRRDDARRGANGAAIIE